MATASVLADLDSIRNLFNEKEKELSVAVKRVDDLTHQLEELRSGRLANGYPPQVTLCAIILLFSIVDLHRRKSHLNTQLCSPQYSRTYIV